MCIHVHKHTHAYTNTHTHMQIVLYGVLSFIREIFLGQQGVLTMMADQ